MLCSCQSELSEVSSSQAEIKEEVKEEDKKPEKNPLLEERPVLSSDKEITWTNEEAVAEEQTPWRRKFELQFSIADILGDGGNPKSLLARYTALTNYLKKNNIKPSNTNPKDLAIKRLVKKGFKNHYADKEKKTLAKQEFYQKAIFVFVNKEKKELYHSEEGEVYNEKIYLKNGVAFENPKIQKSVGNEETWKINSVSYKEGTGAAIHVSSFTKPSSGFNKKLDAIYGIGGKISVTFRGKNEKLSVSEGIDAGRFEIISNPSLIAELQNYEDNGGSFGDLATFLKKSNGEITLTLAFEDLPDFDFDYNDGTLTIKLGTTLSIRAEKQIYRKGEEIKIFVDKGGKSSLQELKDDYDWEFNRGGLSSVVDSDLESYIKSGSGNYIELNTSFITKLGEYKIEIDNDGEDSNEIRLYVVGEVTINTNEINSHEKFLGASVGDKRNILPIKFSFENGVKPLGTAEQHYTFEIKSLNSGASEIMRTPTVDNDKRVVIKKNDGVINFEIYNNNSQKIGYSQKTKGLIYEITYKEYNKEITNWTIIQDEKNRARQEYAVFESIGGFAAPSRNLFVDITTVPLKLRSDIRNGVQKMWTANSYTEIWRDEGMVEVYNSIDKATYPEDKIHVSSSWRSPYVNKAANGIADSTHTTGKGIDIKLNGIKSGGQRWQTPSDYKGQWTYLHGLATANNYNLLLERNSEIRRTMSGWKEIKKKVGKRIDNTALIQKIREVEDNPNYKPDWDYKFSADTTVDGTTYKKDWEVGYFNASHFHFAKK